MSKKQKILALVFLLPSLGMFCQFDLLATSGRISGDSICTSGGVTYGRHGDGHWHQATRTPTCEEILKKPDLFVIDSDGAQLGLTCDHVQVDESNNRVIIRAADQYGVGDEFFVDYKVLPRKLVYLPIVSGHS